MIRPFFWLILIDVLNNWSIYILWNLNGTYDISWSVFIDHGNYDSKGSIIQFLGQNASSISFFGVVYEEILLGKDFFVKSRWWPLTPEDENFQFSCLVCRNGYFSFASSELVSSGSTNCLGHRYIVRYAHLWKGCGSLETSFVEHSFTAEDIYGKGLKVHDLRAIASGREQSSSGEMNSWTNTFDMIINGARGQPGGQSAYFIGGNKQLLLWKWKCIPYSVI